MSSATLPLALAAGLYLWQAGAFIVAGQYGLAAAFLSYAVANVGFIFAARGI